MTVINTKNWRYYFKDDGFWIYRGYIDMRDFPANDSNDKINLKKSKYTTQIIGGYGNDTLLGSSKHMNFLYGDLAYEVFGTEADNQNYFTISGNDIIYGGNSSDYINAGPGSDTIKAGNGTNVIMFKQGDGKDTIIQSSKGKDYLFFVDTDYNNISLSRIGKNLIIKYGDNNDEITVKSYFNNISKSSLKGIADKNTNLDKIEQAFNAFYDTSEKEGIKILKENITQTKSILSILEDQQYIDTQMVNSGKFYGTIYNDNIIGTLNNDRIIARKGNDKINAGTGKNYIYFSINDGNDIIEDGGGNDILVFSNVKKISNIIFYFDDDTNDLTLLYGNDDTITIKNYSDEHSVQKIKIGKKIYNISDRINIHNNDNFNLGYSEINALRSEITAFCTNKDSNINLNYNDLQNTNDITGIIMSFSEQTANS